MVLEELVHAKSGCADRALVGQMGGLKSHVVIARNVVEKLPLEYLKGFLDGLEKFMVWGEFINQVT